MMTKATMLINVVAEVSLILSPWILMT